MMKISMNSKHFIIVDFILKFFGRIWSLLDLAIILLNFAIANILFNF